jgi:peroxiredoxin
MVIDNLINSMAGRTHLIICYGKKIIKGLPALTGLLCLLFILSLSGQLAALEVKTLELGQKAPDFNLPGTDGRSYTLRDFASARVLVIVFTANHCPTAQAYEERLKELASRYGPRGVALLAVSPNDPLAVRLDELGYSDLGDTFEDMKIRANDRQFNFPYLYDGETQTASRLYGPTATPHVFIFDEERMLRYCGRVDNAEKPERIESHDAANAIEALLDGRKPPVAKTKTFGCSIKWADKRQSLKAVSERWAVEEVIVKQIDEQGVKDLVANRGEKLRLVNVWASWCGPCVEEFVELVEINRSYRNRDFELVTVSADSPKKSDKVLEFLQAKQASCTNYHFSGDDQYSLIEAVDRLWPGSLPFTLLIEPGGKVIYRKLGRLDQLELRKKIVGYLGRYYE